jgi:hypothetical protein
VFVFVLMVAPKLFINLGPKLYFKLWSVSSEAEVKAESERAQLQLPLKRPKQTPVRQSLSACSAQECVCGAEELFAGKPSAGR